RVGRVLYKYANASLRVLMPSAYGDRKKLTPAVQRHYLEVFRERGARVEVLHALARAILQSRNYYADLYARAARLHEIPALIVWGMKDTAFQPSQLDRWRVLLPDAEICRLEGAGHWPHEEAPDRVIDAIEDFLGRHAATDLETCES